MGEKLDGGAVFPDIELELHGGGTMRLPQDVDTPWTAVLFYRGHW